MRREPHFWSIAEPVPRTALLSQGFRASRDVFPVNTSGGNDWLQALDNLRPQSLAGSVQQLLFLATMRRVGRVTLSSVDHSVVALIGLGEPWPSDAERDELWAAFEVPLFEQLLDFTGTGLTCAFECESHDGLHVVEGTLRFDVRDGALWASPAEGDPHRAFATGLPGRLLDDPCPCGRPGPRLLVA